MTFKKVDKKKDGEKPAKAEKAKTLTHAKTKKQMTSDGWMPKRKA